MHCGFFVVWKEQADCSQVVDEYVRRPDVKRRDPDAIDSSELT